MRAANWTPERREAMRVMSTGRTHSAETRQKLRELGVKNSYNRGVPHSPEFIAQMSARVKEAYSSGRRVQKHSEETKKRMSEAHKKITSRKPMSEASSLKKSLKMKGRKHTHQRNVPREVAVWVPGSMLPRIYASVVVAAEHYSCHVNQLRQWVLGNIPPKNGHAFAYA